jgi:hypothetical protein
MNEREVLKLQKQLAFYERLTALLNGVVKEKGEEIRKNEMFCDALKWKVTRMTEEVYKLDFLDDDFDLRSFVAQNIDAPIERMKVQLDKPWLRDKLTIGLMGHFNSGKTTALNLIFDENFATRNRENTALATYLVSGDTTNKLTLVDKGGKSQIINIEEGELFDYAKGIRNFPFARIFDYLVKESKNKVLTNLTFIDTPGLSSTNEHSEPTMKAVSSCDAIFWFVNLTESVSEDDIKFIKKHFFFKEQGTEKQIKPIYVILSFADDVESMDESAKVVRQRFRNEGIAVKAYFLLGRDDKMKSTFKNLVTSKLHEVIGEYDVYNPYAHIYAIVLKFEEIVLGFQKALTEGHNRLDQETDKIADAYKNSQNKYSSACNSCVSRLNNMADTFNNRCSGATFCGGASGAMASDFNGVVSALQKMGEAYDNIDIQKLVEYGHKISQMGELQSKINRSSEVLAEIKEIKSIFED